VDAALALLVFAPGLAIGSFLNVVAARVPLRRSLVAPRSACAACTAPIAWYDNIPLLSYAFLRGRCRSCAARIPWKYPAVELGTAILVSACFVRFGLDARAVVAAFFCAALVTVTVTDFEHRVIPNSIVLPAAAIVVVAQTAIDRSPVWAVAALAGAVVLFGIALAYPGGMGMGDVKLMLLLGAALGLVLPVALMIGMIAAMLPAAALFARHGRSARKMAIPFGPFLALGGVVALFAGHAILDGYLRVF